MKRELGFKGKRVSYSKSGTGPGVVLVHGFAEDASVWEQQVVFLKTNFTLITPDLPGCGGSEVNTGLGMEDLADLLKAILDYEDLHSVHMLGHSMGGYITLAFAERYPVYLKGFGLVHSSAFADSEEKIAARKKGIQFIKDNGGPEFLKTMVPGLFSEETRQKRPELVQNQLDQASSINDVALVSYYEAMVRRPDRTEILRQATVPVLFTMGKYDNAVPISDTLKQTHLPEISYIHMLYQSGHMGMLEETEKVNLLIQEFLTANITA